MKLYRGNNIGPGRERWMKEHLRLEPIEITEEEIEMNTPFPEGWDGNIRETEVFQRGVRAAAKTILSKLKGE